MKRSIALTLLILVTVTATFAQKVAPYKITAIRIMPFDEVTGQFRDTLAPDDTGGWGNDLSMSILAVIELAGTPGSFADKRTVSVRVMEGRKLKVAKTGYPGVFSESGRYYVPVWINGSVCDNVTITATMLGQTTKSSMTRKLSAHCGE